MNKLKEINVLIIDIDRAVKNTVRKILINSSYNFSVCETEIAGEALSLLKENSFHCIILDYILEGTDGIKILEKLRDNNISIPVIILTEHGDEIAAVKAMKAGAYDYLPKRILAESNFPNILIKSVINAIKLHQLKTDSKRTMRSLVMREERYRIIVENSPILILRFSPEDNMISFVNDGFCSYFNTNRYEVLGENFYDIIPDELTERIMSVVGSLNSSNMISTFENYSIIQGVKRWQFWTLQVLCDNRGEILEYQCMGEDITDIKIAELEVQNQKKYLQSILDSQDNMIIVTDDVEILLANSSFLDFFGYGTLNDLKKDHKSIADLVYNADGNKVESENSLWTNNILNNNDKYNLVAFKQKDSDELRFFSAVASKLLIDIERYVISFTDVTELEMKSKNFEHKASFDMLTKIYNRQKFSEIFLCEISKRDYNKFFSVIFFDIDNFKKINDTFGHDVGDYVLVEISGLVKDRIRNSDIFARWGGEEFIILLPGADLKNAVDIAEKIRIMIKNTRFKNVNRVTCSFGVVTVREDDDYNSILKRVDKALYKAKESGRNRVVAIRNRQIADLSLIIIFFLNILRIFLSFS